MTLSETDFERFAAACNEAEKRQRAAGGIGTLGERTLHAALKLYYEPNADLHEVGVGRFVADIKNESGITEIQTRGFHLLRAKLEAFLPLGSVTVVYPLAVRKQIYTVDAESGEILSGRKSPRREAPLDILPELSRILPFLQNENLSFRLPLLEVAEYRRPGGRRWRNGTTRLERLPLALFDEVVLGGKSDYYALLPETLPSPFTTAEFAKAAKRNRRFAQTALRVLTELCVTERCGKEKNAYLYRIRPEK